MTTDPTSMMTPETWKNLADMLENYRVHDLDDPAFLYDVESALRDAARLLEETRATPNLQILTEDGSLKESAGNFNAACLDCGKPYAEFPLDLLLPRAQWLEIHPEGDGGLLCACCMVARAAKVPGATVVHAVIEIAPRLLLEETRAQAANWQPIETHDGSPMSVLTAESAGGVVEAYYSAEHDVWWEINSCDDGAPGSDRRVYPTHWMPLPSAPLDAVPSLEGNTHDENETR